MWVPKIRFLGVTRACLVLVVAVASGAMLLSTGTFMGYRTAPVLSESMEPAIRKGSLLISRRVSPRAYTVGDVILFRVPFHGSPLVVHRLSGLNLTVDGVWVANTKGDANSSGDAWTLSLGNIEGKAVAAVPYLGYPVAWARTSFGFLVLVLLSFVVCVFWEIRWLVSFLGRRRRES